MGPSRYNHLSSFCQVGGDGAVFLFLRFCVFAFPFSVPVIRLKEIIPETLAFACFAAWSVWRFALGIVGATFGFKVGWRLLPFEGGGFSVWLFVFVRKLSGD